MVDVVLHDTGVVVPVGVPCRQARCDKAHLMGGPL